MRTEHVGEIAGAQVRHHLAGVIRFQNVVAQAINLAPLIVGNIVIFEQLLADIEVARFDLALCTFDRSRHHAGFDRLTLGQFEAIHDRFHLVSGENAQQRILHRQIKARRTGIALPARAAAQLIINSA